MNRKKTLCLFIIYLFLSNNLSAQKQLSDSAVFHVFRNAQSRLMNTANYKYDIFYKYSNESTPLKVLDTLRGFLERDSSNYHLRLGNVEMIRNTKYSMSFFNDDKIIYLVKAQPDSASINPLLQFNSLLQSFPLIHGFVTTSKSDSTITIIFPDSSLYKSIVFTISKQNHIINRIVYLIKSEALTENGTIAEEDRNKYEKYARVEAVFSNLKISTKSQTDYNDSAYIKREGNTFAGVGKYAGYKIIIGSPEL